MSIRLPPLEALRYFEAAARHLSFTLAADELCVSQSAVSQKVIKLEDRLGYKLFERHSRQLVLTEQGATLFPVIHASLIEIRDSLNKIESNGQMRKLTVYCMPSFASSWLLPRLHDFHTRYPHIDLNLVAELAEPNFHNEIVDIGICHGIGDQPTMEQQLLFWDYVYPVASPALLEQCPLTTLQELNTTVLIHDSLPQAKLSTSWQRWLVERGIRNIDCGSGYRFNQADFIVRAAIDGRGVALGRHVLVAHEVQQGRLIPLFGDVEKDDGVYVVCLKKLIHRPQVETFMHWLKEQAHTFESEMAIDKIVFPKEVAEIRS
ncbi:transcriptional regulator GcvA [Celerinatantimonas sp. YJH-8]|uniref:transcriptional regulator GcvA n=1 Tax=Celerinatantimonas sp. YJH-8 TaxID=3228714 RepID=UPI0038C29AE2